MSDIRGKIALVTGGSKGIGLAIAAALAGHGVHTAICSRNGAGCAELAAEIALQTSSRVLGYACDVRQAQQVERLFEEVVTDFGGLDILINNAGIGIMRDILSLSVEDWQAVIETNLHGAFYCCRQAIPHMQRRGGGYIINISSLAGSNAFKGGTAYNASKFGLNGLSEALMQDVRYHGIRVSYIMPGSVRTTFGGHVAGAQEDWKIDPQDIADMVLHLLTSPEKTLASRVEMRPSQPRK